MVSAFNSITEICHGVPINETGTTTDTIEKYRWKSFIINTFVCMCIETEIDFVAQSMGKGEITKLKVNCVSTEDNYMLVQFPALYFLRGNIVRYTCLVL